MGELLSQPNQSAASSEPQKQNVLDTTATGIELLNAVYKGSKIVDFEIAWINAAARKQYDHFPTAGIPLAGSFRNYADRLEKMIEVAEKGRSFEAVISMSKNCL